MEAAVLQGVMPATMAIHDGAAVLFQDGRPSTIYAWKDEATARIISKAFESSMLRSVYETLPAPLIDLRCS